MELKIINKNKEPLLARIKVEAEVIFEKATPSREEIKNKLATDLSKDKKLIVVKAIYTIRGLKKATNLSYVYENEEALKRYGKAYEFLNRDQSREIRSSIPLVISEAEPTAYGEEN